jgi:glycosyltransferase involved in cell wall biosynthesis
MYGLNLEKIYRTILIMPNYLFKLLRSDVVLVFSNDLFLITIVPIMLCIAKLLHKPIYIKPIGSSLDIFISRLKKPMRTYLLAILRASSGILAQTHLLKMTLEQIGCSNVHYLPGCRSKASVHTLINRDSNEFRVIFLAHIGREKGPLILLEAMKSLISKGGQRIICNFYGPVHDQIRDEFFRILQDTPNSKYCGMVEYDDVHQKIAEHDVLVLPTYFECEGHPGVIIEAMHVGIPVISTYHRAIPELITNGKNGLLVPIKDSRALANAITQIAQDSTLRERMGQENSRRGQGFRSDLVVARLVKIIFQT